MKREKRVKLFSSFAEENAAEHKRKAAMTPEECWHELALLQKRRWGENWTNDPIVKKASFEKLDW